MGLQENFLTASLLRVEWVPIHSKPGWVVLPVCSMLHRWKWLSGKSTLGNFVLHGQGYTEQGCLSKRSLDFVRFWRGLKLQPSLKTFFLTFCDLGSLEHPVTTFPMAPDFNRSTDGWQSWVTIWSRLEEIIKPNQYLKACSIFWTYFLSPLQPLFLTSLPSSPKFGHPISSKRHAFIHQENAQTQTLFVIAFIGSLDDLTLFVPMLVGKGFLDENLQHSLSILGSDVQNHIWVSDRNRYDPSSIERFLALASVQNR